MSHGKETGLTSPTKLSGLSPQKYGKTAFRELSYTPEKLSENFLYKEVTVTKKIEVEKKRIRELESTCAVQVEKIRQLETENDTLRKSYQLQIDMYKQMLKEQEDEKAKHIRTLQTNYNLEIQRLLNEHEEDSKVAQAEKEELEARIAELLRHLEELEYKLAHGNQANEELTQNLELTTQNLKNTQEKLSKAEELARMNQERSNNQISSLNKQLDKERASFRQQLETTLNDKSKEIDGLRKLHQTELDKMENKRAAEMAAKNLELKELAKTFEGEGRRLDDIIGQKDRTNTNLTNDLNKERQTNAALTKHYETELNELLHQKEMLLADMNRLNEERNNLALNLHSLELEFGQTQDHSEMMVAGLRGQLQQKHADLFRENERLVRTIETYEQELALMKDQNRKLLHGVQADTTRVRLTADQLADENRHLTLEINNLRDVLMESSIEMERCKQEFIRLDRDKERILRGNHELEAECARYRALLTERDLQARQWRDTYTAMQRRY